MAAVASPAENAADLMGKLTLDVNSKARDSSEVTKNYEAVNGKEGLNTSKPTTPLIQDYMNANMCFSPSGYSPTAIYYGGYDASTNEMEGYSRYVNPEGVEMPHLGVYGDVYHHGYGYGPYPYPSPSSPIPTLGHDGQFYAPHYTTTYYQPPTPPSGPYTPNLPPTSQGEVSTSVSTDQPISVDTSKAKSNGISNGNANGRSQGFSTGGHLSAYQDPRYGFTGIQSPLSWYNGSMFHDGQHRQATNNGFSTMPHTSNNSTNSRNLNYRQLPHLMGSHTPRPTTGMYPNNRIYTQCGSAFRASLGSGSSLYDSKANGRWVVVDENKYKPRVQGNGLYGYVNPNLDGLSELNRGPRACRFKNQKGFGPTGTISKNGNIEESSTEADKDRYNRADFPVEYSDAKFFVIKSYSEDDVHRSIKYGVWASTPNGNKKLDAAYQESQKKTGGCPLFLLFSVNTSGQFVGVAEMVGPVDFDKTVDYWQQDKWTGCFPAKWHVVKDVPNNILKHIILENNDNKPVTNSRDTQEVKLEQGLQMLKLFKEHASKTSILDDFGFYETRQKAMQDNRAKQQLLQKQVADLKPLKALDDREKDGATGKPRLQKPLETSTFTMLKREAVRPADENGIAAVAVEGDAMNITKPVTEKRAVSNGVANGVSNGVANGC